MSSRLHHVGLLGCALASACLARDDLELVNCWPTCAPGDGQQPGDADTAVTTYLFTTGGETDQDVLSQRLDPGTGDLLGSHTYRFPSPIWAVALAATPDGRTLYVSRHEGSTGAAVLSILRIHSDGTLSAALPELEFPTWTQLGDVAVHPSGSFLFLAGAGDDEIYTYAIDASDGSLARVGASPCGAGIWLCTSLAVHPGGSYLYVVASEGVDTVGGFSIDGETGELTELAGAPYATGNSVPNIPAKLAFDRSGSFLYVGSHDGSGFAIAGFAVGSDGTLALLPDSPFGSDGTGVHHLVLHRATNRLFAGATGSLDNLRVFDIAPNGALTESAVSPVRAGGYYPTGLAIDSQQRYLAAPNVNDGDVRVFAIADGTVAEVPGSPFASTTEPAYALFVDFAP